MVKEYILVPLESVDQHVETPTEVKEIILNKQLNKIRKKVEKIDDKPDDDVKKEADNNYSNFDKLTPDVNPVRDFNLKMIQDIKALRTDRVPKFLRLYKAIYKNNPKLFDISGNIVLNNNTFDDEDLLDVIIYAVNSKRNTQKPIVWNYFFPLIKQVPNITKLVATHLKSKLINKTIHPEDAAIIQLDYD